LNGSGSSQRCEQHSTGVSFAQTSVSREVFDQRQTVYRFTPGLKEKKKMKLLIGKQSRPWIYALIAMGVIFLLIGLGVGVGVSHGGFSPIEALYPFSNAAAQEPKPTTAPQGLPDFVALAKKLKPEVVNISTTQAAKEVDVPNPFDQNDPSGESWKKFFGAPVPRGQLKPRSLGSGFIIEPNGLILTNYHVVDNAERITVRLSDERVFEGKVVGKDKKTDIALVKISARNLPVAPLGDSDRLEVGEWVMAIGNPFGLDYTVTSGIVSAKDREIGAGPYDHFIQTDASINPGNSGGPLINLQGEVVGIDSAIFSESGGNIGIGFAIPINLVKELLPQLQSVGTVTRGWLGVSIQRMTPDLAASLGLDKAKGALVSSVVPGSPADRAGIKAGDVIVGYEGKEINNANELPFLVARTPVGKTVSLHVFHEKKSTTLNVTVEKMNEEETVASTTEKGGLGLTVEQITPEVAENLGLNRTRGVVITAVAPDSVGDEAGLEPGDIIREIDHKPIRNLSDYKKIMAGAVQDKSVLFLVQREESTIFLALRKEE
jgi:serine protease Do